MRECKSRRAKRSKGACSAPCSTCECRRRRMRNFWLCRMSISGRKSSAEELPPYRIDRRDHQQRPPRGGIGESPGRGAQDHAGEKAFHPGAAGGRETGVRGTERPGQARPAEEAPGAGRLMSRSKKWRLEWSFFLGENGRRQYNKLCKGCVHPCKQSFRAVVVSCPHYLSLRSQKCRN